MRVSVVLVVLFLQNFDFVDAAHQSSLQKATRKYMQVLVLGVMRQRACPCAGVLRGHRSGKCVEQPSGTNGYLRRRNCKFDAFFTYVMLQMCFDVNKSCYEKELVYHHHQPLF
eukprot:scaffold64191_cov23-Tisochrysis_lutea.AAC.2